MPIYATICWRANGEDAVARDAMRRLMRCADDAE